MAEPLRAIVSRLTTFACAWTAEEVASLSEVSLSGVRRFLTSLVHLGVLALAPSGQYSAGPQAKPWRDLARKHKGPSTYGNSAKYRAQRAVWDGIRQRDWTERKRGIGAVLTSQQTAAPSLGAPQHAGDSKMAPSGLSGTSLTYEEAADALNISVDTVRREIRRGKIKAFRIGLRGVRISTEEVSRYRTANLIERTAEGGKASP